jgi:hypothetical protein
VRRLLGLLIWLVLGSALLLLIGLLAALLLLLRLLLSGILRLLVRHTALQLNPSPKPGL